MPASGRSASLVAVAVSALTHSYARRSRWTVDGRQRIGEARSSSRNVDPRRWRWLVPASNCQKLVVLPLSHDRINHNCTQALPSMTSRPLPPMAARCIFDV